MSSETLDNSSAPSDSAAESPHTVKSRAPAGPDDRSLMISVGDHSAERYVVKILDRIKEIDPDLKVWGAGGPMMQAQGVEVLYDLSDFSVIGLTEVI